MVKVPRHEDKESLLKYAYDNLGNVAQADAKYMIPAVINATHLFADGNGRTSRVMFQLMNEYTSEEAFSKNLELSLGEYGRLNSPDINPEIVSVEINKYILRQNGWVYTDGGDVSNEGIPFGIATVERKVLQEELSLDQKTEIVNALEDNMLLVLTAARSALGDDVLRRLLTDKYTRKMLSPVKMMEQLSPGEWQRFLDAYYALKKEQVKILVDLFVNPEAFVKHLMEDDSDMTLKDFFIQKIQENV